MSPIYMLILFIELVVGCPENETPPCSCRMIGNHSSVVKCTAADCADSLSISIKSMGSMPIRTVEIFESNILHLPENIFEGMKFQNLFIAGTTLMSLSDTETAFVGLENSLEVLKIYECSIFDGLDWHQLRNLHNLKEIQIRNTDIRFIDDEIKSIDGLHLTNLILSQGKITFISDYAFSSFKHLTTLSLKRNHIKVLKRTMLPDPADELSNIILSYNEIDSLPKDLFSNMTKLIAVSLAGNEILTMDFDVFKPVWSQLNKIDILGNDLRCDCRMKWIVQQSFPKNTWGTCSEPIAIHGKELTQLQDPDLWC